MTNKKCRFMTAFAVFLSLAGILGLTALYMREYRRGAFLYLSAFCETMAEESPEMEEAVLACVKKYCDYSSPRSGTRKRTAPVFLEQYGYSGEEFSGMLSGDFIAASTIMTIMSVLGLAWAVWYPYRYRRARAVQLTDYLEEINSGGEGTVLPAQEDGFSHLQDEMHKTVTQLYRTREQAVEEKMNYADNLANIAHQLKTPITAALLSLQLMKEEESETEKAEYADRVARQLERLHSLEEALLVISKVDAGVLRLERKEVDVYTVLSLAADNLEELFRQQGVSVRIPDLGCVTFQGDMEWTMEAVMNLMKNCIEHSGEGGAVYCDYSVNPLYTQIRIWDEGTGFAAEDIPHLFERFYRGKGVNEKGVGLGLPLARSVFELQNGTLTAHNLPQGGACFEIKIYRHSFHV